MWERFKRREKRRAFLNTHVFLWTFTLSSTCLLSFSAHVYTCSTATAVYVSTESVCVCRFVRLIEKRHCFQQAEKRGNICHVVQRLHAAGRRVIVCLCDYGPSTSDGFTYQRYLHHYVSAFINTYRQHLFFLPLESFYLLLSAHTSCDEVLLAQLES